MTCCTPQTRQRRIHGGGSYRSRIEAACRIAAAGLAGAVLMAKAAVPVCASAGPGFFELKSPGAGAAVLSCVGFRRDSEDRGPAADGNGTASDPSLNDPAFYWNEDEILNRWGLDSEDFPSVPEEPAPCIPDELLPYFQEAVDDAVSWYSGETIPETDLSKYTIRADAIRREVRELARETAEKSIAQLTGACRMLAGSAGGRLADRLVCVLQDGGACEGAEISSRSAASACDPGRTASSPRSGKGIPVPIGACPYSDSCFACAEALQEKTAEDRPDPSGTGLIPRSGRRKDPEDPYVYPEQRRTVFIGDSRTVGMEMICGGTPDEYWTAQNGRGYSWMVSTGIPNVENLIDRNTDVVILMGVNDLGNVYSYVDYVNEKAAEWKELGARTYFVSVTPVDDRRSPNITNQRIESFNTYVKENLQDVHYIDAYSRIRYSFASPDGVHFDASTYREIYCTIKFSLYRGWYEQDGLWFYFDNGRPVTGWHNLDGQWQYMDGYGVRLVRSGGTGALNSLPFPDFDPTGRDTAPLSF